MRLQTKHELSITFSHMNTHVSDMVELINGQAIKAYSCSYIDNHTCTCIWISHF